MYIKACKICGKEIVTESSKKCLCSEECKAENKRQNAQIHNAKAREIRRTVKSMSNNKLSITDIAVKAREAEMTYGQYVTKMKL